MHLRNVAKVRLFLTKQDAEKLIDAFIISILDYCNEPFTGSPKELIGRLELIKTKKIEHITPFLS